MPKTKPNIEISDPYLLYQSQIEELKKSFNFIITFIVGVMMIGFLVLLFTVVGMIIEAWRFNSAAYKESQQLQLQEENIKNTVSQQKQIIDSLNSIKQDLDIIKGR